MNINFIKTAPQVYKPAEPETEEWDRKTKIGQWVSGPFRKVRNPGFHRKYFALLHVGFDNWDPPADETAYGRPQKNFTEFRHNVAILCGFKELVVRIDGSSKWVAKSISFATMEDAEFQDLYNKTIDLFIDYIYGKENMTREQMNNIVNQYMSFA